MQQQKIMLPPIIFGTSGLGNIYHETTYEKKFSIVKECINDAIGIPMFDSAGKYGAGMALEVLGKCLKELEVNPDDVVISNKLAWYQVPLKTPEPTFEKGIWKHLTHDAVQRISYQGIIDCYQQGNALLGNYNSGMASVHDPDEYLATANNKEEEDRLYQDILEAYRALGELKAQGKVKSIGVGSKQWKVVERISKDVKLDWVMIANSLTLHSHPIELVEFIGELCKKGISVINSAVFNGGFLTGGDHYNYRYIDGTTEEGKELFRWRHDFFEICHSFGILPAEACMHFGFNIAGITSIAISTTNQYKVRNNINMLKKQIPAHYWETLVSKGLMEEEMLQYTLKKSINEELLN